MLIIIRAESVPGIGLRSWSHKLIVNELIGVAVVMQTPEPFWE